MQMVDSGVKHDDGVNNSKYGGTELEAGCLFEDV